MLDVADLFRLHGAAYRALSGDRLLPRQTRALDDIEACRTAYFGGHVYQCDPCEEKAYVHHSYGNRSCSKCHRKQTERWLGKQLDQARALLNVPSPSPATDSVSDDAAPELLSVCQRAAHTAKSEP